MATVVFLNPGSGSVNGADERHAVASMSQFIKDSHINALAFVRSPEHDNGDGRFAFTVLRRGFRDIVIHMPGQPLEQVRYLRLPEQNIWNFPRLYKDGASWVWYFAIIDDDDYDSGQ